VERGLWPWSVGLLWGPLHRLCKREARGQGRADAANVLWCLGFPTQAVRRSQETLALAHPYSLAVAQHWATLLHYRCRDVPAVLTQADALLTLATAQGFPLDVRYGTS
jgi:hypothetical protein